jgi:hypothetical protein
MFSEDLEPMGVDTVMIQLVTRQKASSKEFVRGCGKEVVLWKLGEFGRHRENMRWWRDGGGIIG